MKLNDIVYIGSRECVVVDIRPKNIVRVVYLSDKKEFMVDNAKLVEGQLKFIDSPSFTAERTFGRYEHACSILRNPELWARVEQARQGVANQSNCTRP